MDIIEHQLGIRDNLVIFFRIEFIFMVAIFIDVFEVDLAGGIERDSAVGLARNFLLDFEVIEGFSDAISSIEDVVAGENKRMLEKEVSVDGLVGGLDVVRCGHWV
jgi:hypothetical protein